MDKRKQIYFRDSVLKDYPNTEKFFTDLSGNDRSRAFLAALEAFMTLTSSQNKSARGVYHLAESMREDPGEAKAVNVQNSNTVSPTAPASPVSSAPETEIIGGDIDDLNDLLNPPTSL